MADPGRRDRAAAVVERRCSALGPDDPSDILFTSGTTGVPKGVVMTHGRTLRVATDWVAMTGLGADDRYLMVNPYFHMFGLKAGILACVAGGATMLPEPVFDVDRILGRVDQEQVTVLPGPPTLYQSILDHPRQGSAPAVLAAGGGDRGRRHPRGAGAPYPSRSCPSRRSSPATGSPRRARRRPRRPATTPRPSPPPSAGRGPGSSSASWATTVTCPPGRPARWSCGGGA